MRSLLMKKIKSIKVLDSKISIVNYEIALSVIEKQIEKKKSHYVCAAAVHLVMEVYYNPKLQIVVNKSLLTVPDGMPLVWLAKLSGEKHASRVYGPDLMLKTCQLAEEKGYKVFLLGGAKNQGKSLKKNLLQKYPKLKVAGVQETPIRPIPSKENEIILNKIRRSEPQIIFVGLGCPLQEKWMSDNYQRIKKGVLIGVGAAFDFISGKVKQAPVFMQNLGLEWLFRLYQEPLRLWKRYLILNSAFVFHIAKKKLQRL